MPDLNLVIDIGNTQTKVALFRRNEMVHLFHYNTLQVSILQSLNELYKPTKAIVSCVGAAPESVIQELSVKIPVINFSASVPVPIVNSYDSAETLGPDRLAAAVGANFLYSGENVLAVGCGTAITFDVVTSRGEYLGGAISPGINIRFRALHEFTAKLPLVEMNENYPFLATTTRGSILSGVLHGAIHEVDGYIAALNQKFSDFRVILSGGDANFFVGKLKNPIFVHPNLVLIGLNRILYYND